MDTAKLLEELTRDEALKLKPYRCSAGKLTIGIGRNLDDKGITPAEARYLAENDVAAVVAGLEAHIPWWKELDAVRQRVLANMAFNLGVDGLLEFKRTLAAVQVGNYTGAAAEMLESKWATQVGQRAQRLARMMLTGGAA